MKKFLNMIVLGMALALVLGMVAFAEEGSGYSTGTRAATGGDTVTEDPGNTGTEDPDEGDDETDDVTGNDPDKPGNTETTDPDDSDGTDDVYVVDKSADVKDVESKTEGVIAKVKTVTTEIFTAINKTVDKQLNAQLNASSGTVSTQLKAVLGNNAKAIKTLDVVASFDLTKTTFDKGNVVVEITEGSIPKLEGKQQYVALHFNADYSTILSVHKVTVSDNAVTIYDVEEFSPYVIGVADIEEVGEDVIDNGNDGSSDDNNNNATTPGTTSPRTGEAIPAAVAVAVLGMAGIAVVGVKRSRFNR